MAERLSPLSASGSIKLPAIPPTATMDGEFIARNQIVERYLAGKLPLKGAQDFERYCRDNPELLEELRLSDRVHAGLRLLDAGGMALPWEQKPRRVWERLPVFIFLAALALGFGITLLIVGGKVSTRDAEIAGLRQAVISKPVEAPVSTQSVPVTPSRTAPSRTNAAMVGGGPYMADLKIDMSWSKFTAFRVTVDRVDQGRVMVLHNLLRDSNGSVRLVLNTTALGPGSYQLAIEGMTLQGVAVPQAWVTVGVSH